MANSVVLGGRRWKIGKAKRDYKMTLDEQLESIKEDYIGFDWIGCSGGEITFYYIRKA